MSTKKVTIQVTGSGILQDDVIMLGEGVLKALKIPSGRPLQLQFGSFRREVTVIPVPRYDGLRINQTVASKTGLVPRSVLRVSYRSASRTLRLGPYISVLVSQDYPDQPDRPFGSITMFCQELVNACRKQGAYVSFFTPEDIGAVTGYMKGWVYDDGWKKTVLPVADVVNNRLTSRKLENKPSVQHFMKEVKSLYGTQTFNEKFLDKNEVFDALKSISTLKRVLPESHLLKTSAMLKTMCNRHPVVFLKPVRGSLGKGIIRVSRQIDGSFLTLATGVGGPGNKRILLWINCMPVCLGK